MLIKIKFEYELKIYNAVSYIKQYCAAYVNDVFYQKCNANNKKS